VPAHGTFFADLAAASHAFYQPLMQWINTN
jgi:hypothetical protein